MFHNFLKQNTKHKTARSVTFSKLVFNCTILAHSCVEDFSVVLWPFNAQNLQCCKCYLSKSQNISPPKASGCRAPWRYPSKGSLKFRWCQKSSRERHPRRFFSYSRCKSSPAAARHPLPWTIFNVVIKLCPLVSHHAKLAHWQTKLINIVCLNHSLEAFGTFYLPLSE